MYSNISSSVILPSFIAAFTGSSSSSSTTGGAIGGAGALGGAGGATGFNTGATCLKGELEMVFFASETPFILFLLFFNIIVKLDIADFTLSLFNIYSSAWVPS